MMIVLNSIAPIVNRSLEGRFSLGRGAKAARTAKRAQGFHGVQGLSRQEDIYAVVGGIVIRTNR